MPRVSVAMVFTETPLDIVYSQKFYFVKNSATVQEFLSQFPLLDEN